MKIFALTTFVLCLICVLSLQVESFEEGKPKTKKAAAKGPSNFAKSCSAIKYDSKKSILSASCKNKKGKKVKASISLAKCVTNKNGKLQKGKAFQKSSSKCSVKGSKLTCKSVKNAKGKKAASTTDLNKFIGNMDGKLKC